MKKVLVYSHDAYGLGNIRRMLEISAHLVGSDQEISLLLISGSPMLHAFRIPERVDYIKLPGVARSDKGESVVKSLGGLSFDDTIRMRANVISMAVLDFEPDLILVDKKPFGIGNELQPALQMLRKRAQAPRTVLLLRDILDEPEATMGHWEKGGYHDAIREMYDQVLVVGEKEVFDAVEEYRFPESTAAKVRYCGYIRRPAPRQAPERIRGDLGVGNQPMVLVTAGGGADGYAMLKAYLEGLHQRPDRGFVTLLVSGPEMSPALREELGELARRAGGVIFREFTDDMMSHMNAADVVVAMGGYNTVCELLTLKKKMIIVPRVEPVKEQWMRAERMERLGLMRMVHPRDLHPDKLMDVVFGELSREQDGTGALERFEMDGLPRIGAAVAELLEGVRRRPAVAARRSSQAPILPLYPRIRTAGMPPPFQRASPSIMAANLQRAFVPALGA